MSGHRGVSDELVLFGRDLDKAFNSDGIGPEGCTPYEDVAAWLMREGYRKDMKPEMEPKQNSPSDGEFGYVCYKHDFEGYA